MVRFDGRDIRGFDPRELRRRVALVMQTPVLFEETVADEVEARLALGFSGREAVQPMVRAALRDAMIPTVNGMMTVGVVQLPGMMTGQILAGSSPLVAIRYQMVVVFMLAAATALGSLLFVRLAAARYLTAAHQLRRYLL
jgi:putative ABC transport system permease protein